MKRAAGCALLGLAAAPLWLPAQVGETPPMAISIVRNALNAMGGEQNLRAVESVKFMAIGHRNELEQSERPEGPYIVEYDQIREIRDLKANSLRRSIEAKVAMQPKFEAITTVSGGTAINSFAGHSRPGTPGQVMEANEELALGPERVLLNALSASDLRVEPDTILQSVRHHVMIFKWGTIPVRVFLNANTGLPTAVEWVSANPYDGFWSTWGDVTTRVYYSFWWLASSGIHYPLQWNTEKNGLPDHTWTIDELEINPRLPADTFAILDTDRTAYQKNASVLEQGVRAESDNRPLSGGVGFYPGIIHFPGAWNTTLIRQPDGIVVLEAPISAAYSQRVLAEVQRRFPQTPVKAVISTSDSWPHFSGLREYVARGIPVYILDSNRPILERFVASPRTVFPDALAKSPRDADFRGVAGKTMVGEGPNRLEIYPLRGETSERQMMVYFPEHRLLYGSDLFQKLDENTYFYPQTVGELLQAVEREHIAVEKFFMMHVGLTSWSEMSAAMEKAGGPTSTKPE